MTLTTKLIPFATAMFLSANVFAAGNIGTGTIKSLQSTTGGWLLTVSVSAFGGVANPDACSSAVIVLEDTHLQFKEIYSLILAAYTTNKFANITVNGCDMNGNKRLSAISTAWN